MFLSLDVIVNRTGALFTAVGVAAVTTTVLTFFFVNPLVLLVGNSILTISGDESLATSILSKGSMTVLSEMGFGVSLLE